MVVKYIVVAKRVVLSVYKKCCSEKARGLQNVRTAIVLRVFDGGLKKVK